MVVVGFETFRPFTLVGFSFVRKNLNIKNQMIVGKSFSRATKWDQPRFSIFVGLEVRVGTGIKSGFKKSGFYCGFFGFFQRKFEKIRKKGFFQILYFTLPKSPKMTF